MIINVGDHIEILEHHLSSANVEIGDILLVTRVKDNQIHAKPLKETLEYDWSFLDHDLNKGFKIVNKKQKIALFHHEREQNEETI